MQNITTFLKLLKVCVREGGGGGGGGGGVRWGWVVWEFLSPSCPTEIVYDSLLLSCPCYF